MKIAFLGTPEFAIPSLDALIKQGHDITVITQPDKRKGRGHALLPPPVKLFALEHEKPVLQFTKIRAKEGVDALYELSPDLMVTAAFGQILSREILEIPKYGCINVHASLLPKYRGAAPAQWCIVDGEKVTGVTTMMTDVGLDTGDILMSEKLEIGENETSGELLLRLADVGASLLLRTIDALVNGTLTRTAQDECEATKCSIIKKEDAHIDFSRPSEQIRNLIRGMNPAPTAYALLNGNTVRIYESKPAKTDELPNVRAGTCFVADAKHGLFVRTGDGAIEITLLQLPGGKMLPAKALLNGKKLLGEVFE